jgi:WD40 repeat protein
VLLERSADTTHCGFSPDGKTLFSRHGGSVLIVWDVAAGKPRHQHPAHEGWVITAAFAPDGKTIATGTLGFDAHAVHLWDAATGQHLRTFQGHDAYVRKLTFTPEGGGIVSGSGDGTLRLWDPKSGKEVRRFSIRERRRRRGIRC